MVGVLLVEASLCLIVINEIPTLSAEQRKTCGRISALASVSGDDSTDISHKLRGHSLESMLGRLAS